MSELHVTTEVNSLHHFSYSPLACALLCARLVSGQPLDVLPCDVQLYAAALHIGDPLGGDQPID